MNVKVSESSITSKVGVNAVRSFFESRGCVFQETSQQNDVGKDAYVDITKSSIVTDLCVALQIKSGQSYRSPDGDYFIPVREHEDIWRCSTVPVFGLVYDPSDRLIRWVDLTGHLRSNPKMKGGSIKVPRLAILDETSLHAEFTAALSGYAAGGRGEVAFGLLTHGAVQRDAVYDAWALGRFDEKSLILLRRLVLELNGSAVPLAIHLLSHVGSHPNIFWAKGNWIPKQIIDKVLPSFRWSPAEIAHMIQAVHPSDYGYGALGESLDVLLYEEPDVVAKLHVATSILLKAGELIYAVRAATLVLSHSRDVRHDLCLLLKEYPVLLEDEWFNDVATAVEESGEYSLYY